MATLDVWMNGERVGEWTTGRSSNSTFRYAQSWAEGPDARPLSLSLPITANREIRGPVVDNYFDNLLPDNTDIRRRIRDRFHLRSTEAFDLLAEIGRDCVGAVQLLPPGKDAKDWQQIDAIPLSSTDVARILRDTTATAPFGRQDSEEEAFRISIAGAQEKTALLQMGGAWHRPRGSTPTTHILKLPLGIIGNFRGDFAHSVENEWLCSKILGSWGLPVADSRIGSFEDQKALIVRRFDRHWIGTDEHATRSRGFKPQSGAWIARLPQEDFCQATGRPAIQRYESDGGASMEEILSLLSDSSNAQADRERFVLSQLAFWLLAATDGHGKNFSIHLYAGGRFAMTPLYDVLSAWPVIGRGARQLPFQRAKLAMAVAGRSRHYGLQDIQTYHWRDLAQRIGGDDLWHRAQEFVDRTAAALETISGQLPRQFPDAVYETIRAGVKRQRSRFLAGLKGASHAQALPLQR